jgi:hypothetical protein
MAQTYEIVFFSLQPGCELKAIQEVLCQLLGRNPEELRRALQSSGTVLISGLSEAEAKSLQVRLVASGLLCNYRPASPPCELSLEPKRFTMPCPHCGRPNQIIENERRRRCRHCRRFWSLWAMRETGDILPLSEPVAVVTPPQRSWTWSAVWITSLLLTSAYMVFKGLPLIRSWAQEAQEPPPYFQTASKANSDSYAPQPAFDPFELIWLAGSVPPPAESSPSSRAPSSQALARASTCPELAQLCQLLKLAGLTCESAIPSANMQSLRE